MVLFSRVAEAFRGIEDREWLLLALETLGVLAGIIVAFELQEWGERRSQAAKHQELMERLFEETENDVASIRTMRDLLKPLVKQEQLFAARLGKGECPSNDDFQAVSTLALMPALTPPTSVYQELMGAGGLSSIERADVRRQLAQFHQDVDWGQKQIDYFRSLKIDPVLDSDPRVHIRFDPSAEEPEVVTYDGGALCRDQKFRNELAAATRQHTVFLSYFQGPLEDSISMCVRLADSLGHRCVPSHGGPLTGQDAQYAARAVATMRNDLAKEQ